ncbi:hypothetical protein SS50377_27568 [Spironucleus salmonicida]|uniref:Uncharacterized protein n=1 Tax=Spironucleus salmonicida TaxID=348837 RepID=A0A9P8RW99_9EUKA|nr:hypothetical protein SS50377_27568 [Spironucleus salmonicida]
MDDLQKIEIKYKKKYVKFTSLTSYQIRLNEIKNGIIQIDQEKLDKLDKRKQLIHKLEQLNKLSQSENMSCRSNIINIKEKHQKKHRSGVKVLQQHKADQHESITRLTNKQKLNITDIKIDVNWESIILNREQQLYQIVQFFVQ